MRFTKIALDNLRIADHDRHRRRPGAGSRRCRISSAHGGAMGSTRWSGGVTPSSAPRSPAASAYSYWRENENGQCVTVRTTDGRYASIVFAPAFDCQGGGRLPDEDKKYDRKDDFETVCGVIVVGENHRYQCEVADFYQGSKKFKTTLHFPDQMFRMRWKPATRWCSTSKA